MRELDRCEFDETDCKNDPLNVAKFVSFTVDLLINIIDQLQKKAELEAYA